MNNNSFSESYKNAGVDVTAGYKSVELMKKSVESTYTKSVLSGIGGFGALYSLSDFKEMKEPILVSGTDGVGTKLKLAFLMQKHDTVGQDCVAMCVNDIICVSRGVDQTVGTPSTVHQFINGINYTTIYAGADFKAIDIDGDDYIVANTKKEANGTVTLIDNKRAGFYYKKLVEKQQKCLVFILKMNMI